MDFSALALPPMNWEFVAAVFAIVLIDIVLAGDNAVVIAMAVKSLPRKQRLVGISLGAGFAVLLRVTLTFFAAHLLQINYVKFIGGILIFWIAVKLLVQDVGAEDGGREAVSIWSATWIIVVADVTMSTDNILALAGASKGSFFLLLFGLILSIPLVVFTSSLLARLMDRFPIIMYAGAAVLGKVSADLMLTDPVATQYVFISGWGLTVAEIVAAVAVIAIAKIYVRLKSETNLASEPGLVDAKEGSALKSTRND